MSLRTAFDLGVNTEWLRCVNFMGEVDVEGKDWVIDTLNYVHGLLKDEKLAADIFDDISTVTQKLQKEYSLEKNKISEEDSSDLKDRVLHWKKRIRSELARIKVLKIEMQSGLNPDELRKVADKQPSGFISEKTWEKLTDIEKSDFSDAARCLLLGTGTPSVMVALRGAEASIRSYYHHMTKDDPRG